MHRIIFVILLLSQQILYSQKENCAITMSGVVSDKHDKTSLQYATIFFQEAERGTVADQDGNYFIELLCPGSYHIVVSHIGCESKVFFISVDKNTNFNFIMEHHDHLLEEVQIAGTDVHNKRGLSKSLISKDIIFELSGKSLSEILSSVPGVSMLKAGPNLTKPVIQGLYGNRITILNHGIPQEGQQWGNDHAPEIDPNTADKISVYKGATAIKYGLQALGGLIIIEPNELVYDPHWHGEIKSTLQSNGNGFALNGSLLNSTPIGNCKVTGGFTQSGDHRTPDYFLTNTGNKQKSFSILLSNVHNDKTYRKFYYSYYASDIGILRGSHIGNLSDLREAFTRKIPFYTSDTFSYKIEVPKQVVYHHLVKYNHRYTVSEATSINLDAAFQANIREEYDIRRGGRGAKPSLDLTLLSNYVDISLNHQSTIPEQYTTIGLQYRYNNNTNNAGTGISPLIPDYINNMFASYIIRKQSLFALDAEFGLRAEYRDYRIFKIINNQFLEKEIKTFFNWAANFGISKKIIAALETNFDLSFTNRPPEINELYSRGLHQGVSGIEEGNDSLKAERSFKISNEWRSVISKKHHLTFSLFYNKIDGYIYLQPTHELRLTIRGAFPVFKYTAADVTMTGINIKLNSDISEKFAWNNNVNYIYALNKTLHAGLIRIPPLSATSGLTFTTGKTRYFNELKIGIDITYTAQQNNISSDEDFLPPPPSYTLTNTFLRIKWKKKSHREIAMLLRCDNLFNVAYRDYLDRLRYFANEMGRNISITINSTF